MRLLANRLSHFPTSCARGSGRPRAEAASYAVAATLIADLSGDGWDKIWAKADEI